VCSNSTILFMTAVDDTPCYSCMYKTEHEPTRRMFADLVRVWEGIGTIGPEETVAEVAARLCRFDADTDPAVRAAEEGLFTLEEGRARLAALEAGPAAGGGAGAGAVPSAAPASAPEAVSAADVTVGTAAPGGGSGSAAGVGTIA
jgi:hypothetical protein